MATLTEQRAATAGIAALRPFKDRGVAALSNGELAVAADIAWGDSNWGGDPLFYAQCRAEMSKRGILAAYDKARVSNSYTVGSIIRDAVVFYGSVFAASYGAAALAGSATPAATASAAPAGALTSGGGAQVVTAAAAPATATASTATAYSGIVDSIVAGATEIGAGAVQTAVTAKVAQAVAPKPAQPQPIITPDEVQPATSSLLLPLALAGLLGAIFFI